MSEARVGRDYDRWLGGPSVSGKLYNLLAGLQGMMLVNTPAFRLHTELQLRPDNRLLDVGCGRGALLQVLASHVPFEKPPVGIDLSGQMVRQGRDDVSRLSRPPALLQGAATSLPFAEGSFDIATSAYLVKHLDDNGVLRFFGELWRVLSPGGIAVIWEFSPTRDARLNSWHKWLLTRGVADCQFRSYTELSALALHAGFEWVGNARLRPFLFPPIPRVSMILGKAPPEWVG